MLVFLVGLQIVVAIALVVIVLIQQGKGAEAGAMLSSGSQSLLGTATSGSSITKFTTILAIIFIVNSMVMAVVSSQNKRTSGSIVVDPQSTDKKESTDVPNIPLPK